MTTTVLSPGTSAKMPLRSLIALMLTIVGAAAGSAFGVASWFNAKQEQQAERDRAQDARIAAVESWRSATQDSLTKIDNRLDKLVEKVGSVAETLGRLDERSRR